MEEELERRAVLEISSKPILRIVREYFNSISPVQWILLVNGTCDMKTRQILHSMFVHLIQSVSATTLCELIQMKITGVRVILEHSIGKIFARALNVPVRGVDTSQELTKMIKLEISEKINSALSADSQEEQMGDRVNLVNSSLSSADVGLRMVDEAIACLRVCLSALTCSCGVRRCYTSPVVNMNPATPRVASESAIYPTTCHCCVSKFARKNFIKKQENIDNKIPSITQPKSTTPVTSITPKVLSTMSATQVHTEVSGNGQRHDLFERSEVHPKACVPSFISRDVPAIVLNTPHIEPELSQSQSMMQCMIASLMVKMFKGKVMLHPKDELFQVIYNRLTEKAWEEIYIPDSQLKTTKKKLEQIINGVMKDLGMTYGTAYRMLKSALDETNETFVANVVQFLKKHLQINLNKPSLLTRVGRFFCKCFCMWCEDDEDPPNGPHHY
ncbi:hypothetical protein WMY93_004172 [Mugilogobius chulae]|uniref:Uncharacterized protein n=1 Tax=Mugilogobius chulae TaxID=88201 RepID=A0AAW0PXH8_9GOBI